MSGEPCIIFKNKIDICKVDNMEASLEAKHGRPFGEVFKEFGDTTTFHGLRYITNNYYNYFRRLIWIVVVLTMTIWLMVNIINAVISLNKHEETTTISINYVRDITFPAVTLCNYNQFRNGTMSKAAIETLGLVYGTSSSRLINEDVDLTPLADEFRNLNDSQIIEHIKNSSHRVEDMVAECSWRSKPCSHLNFTQRVLDHGVCYTFNDPVDEIDALKVRSPGIRNGLYLRLNIQHDLYTFGENTAAGIKVLLHQQGELPIIKELAFSLSPGFETSVAVRRRVVNSLPAPFRDNCTKNNFTDYPFKYSVPACNFLCKIHYVISKCGCRDYRWPAGPEPICSVGEQVYCIYQYEDEFFEKDVSCDCPIGCKTTQYDSKTSVAYWPNVNLLASLNLSEAETRRNFMDVYIFFEEIMYTMITQSEAYTLTNLQGDVGGYMGLLCGMSLITLFEWADFVFISLFKRFRGTRKAYDLRNSGSVKSQETVGI